MAEQDEGGTWRVFSGNEIGMLLAHWLFTKATAAGAAPSALAVVASTVSSKMTRALAHKEGMRFEETLTGFKWICNKKFDLQQQGLQVWPLPQAPREHRRLLTSPLSEPRLPHVPGRACVRGVDRVLLRRLCQRQGTPPGPRRRCSVSSLLLAPPCCSCDGVCPTSLMGK